MSIAMVPTSPSLRPIPKFRVRVPFVHDPATAASEASGLTDEDTVALRCTRCYKPMSWRDAGRDLCRTCRTRAVDDLIRGDYLKFEEEVRVVGDNGEEHVETRLIRAQTNTPKRTQPLLTTYRFAVTSPHLKSLELDDPRRAMKPQKHHAIRPDLKATWRSVFQRKPPKGATHEKVVTHTRRCAHQPQMALTHRTLQAYSRKAA